MTWVGYLISFAVILQSVEFFWITFYRADLIRPEFPRVLRWTLGLQQWIAGLQLLAAFTTLIYPTAIGVLVVLLTTWWLAMRWRGTFNGGSDFMTFQILAAWWVSLLVPQFMLICQFYIVIQLVLSYFVAGVSKIGNRDWRNGRALQVLLGRWGVGLSVGWCLVLGWVTLAFEILFPVALIVPLPFVVVGVAFHLGNAYVLGLNRFFWVWLAAYPLLLGL